MNVDLLYGVVNLDFWGYAAVAFAMVQFTFMGATLYLHRDATHHSIDLHPALRHAFRFWLWLSSGIATKEWVAVHRKHHAHCETAADPHSPAIYGLRKVLLEGAELYRSAARDAQTLAKFGHGTPEDWIERNVYMRHRNWGVALMVTIDLVLFGVPGIIIVAVQMLANPLMAAGVINGLGHHSGYRNFECRDAARNISPWGVLIAGEELHNNHHAFPGSAKFSIRRWEFDIGWMYIRLLQMVGLARVIRLAPTPVHGVRREQIDLETARAVIVNRMHVLRAYARQVTVPLLRKQSHEPGCKLIRHDEKLLVREPLLLDGGARSRLQAMLAAHHTLRTAYDFRERLSALWSTNLSNEAALSHLKSWVTQAEESGVEALREFAGSLRGYALESQAPGVTGYS